MKDLILLDGYKNNGLDLIFNAECGESGNPYIVTISHEEVSEFVRRYTDNEDYKLTKAIFDADNGDIQSTCESILEEWKENEDDILGLSVSFPKIKRIAFKITDFYNSTMPGNYFKSKQEIENYCSQIGAKSWSIING